MTTAWVVLAALAGVGLGAVWAWMAARAAHARLEAELEQSRAREAEHRQQMDALTQSEAALRVQVVELTGQLRAAQTEAARVGPLLERLEAMEREARVLGERNAQLEADLKNAQQAIEERQKLIETAKESFQALAADVLRANSSAFLQLAEQQFGRAQEAARGELEKRRQAVEELVRPLREQLDQFAAQLQLTEKHRSEAYAGLLAQVAQLDQTQQQLRHETARLVNALRMPQVRGQWGESTLRRVVELAGMAEHCDFVEQATIADGERARLRPDLLVMLPGGRRIAVDAKTPLAAYLEYVHAEDETQRAQALDRHAKQLRNHAQSLADKAYWNALQPTPEFVVLFVPGEQFLSAALMQDRTLFEECLNRRVILASPATLLALLLTVAHTWRQEQIARHAEEVNRLGRELYERLQTFCDHLEQLRKGLKTSVEAFNRAVGSLEARVLPAARRFPELGVSVRDRLPEALEPLDLAPRSLETIPGEADPTGQA